jgi:hypothetical protein
MRLDPKLRAGLLVAGLAATLGAVLWVDRRGNNADDGVVAVAERPALAGAPAPAPTKVRGDAAAPSVGNAHGLDLNRLRRPGSLEPGSDPFASRRPKPAVAERSERPPSAPVQAVSVPLPPPAAPPVPYTFIGRLSEDESTTVFLAAGDRNLVVKPGDVIDNSYRVDAVTESAVSLTYLPLNVKQSLSTGVPR